MALDPITAGIEFVKAISDKIWPDANAKAEALYKLEQLHQTGELAKLTANTDLAKGQQAINQIEAQNDNVFVSGARPFFMWVCGSAFAYHYVLQPFMAFFLMALGYNIVLPEFNMETLMTVAMGMLGLGGMRSYEKAKGLTK